MREETQKKQAEKSLLVKLSLATIMGVLPNEVHAQNLICAQPLIFGEIITCGAAGTVTVRPDGTYTSSCVTLGGLPVSNGRCDVVQTFPPAPMVTVTIAAAATISAGGGNTMSLTNFNLVTNAGGTNYTSTAFAFSVPFGATLNVGSAQAAGTYSGIVAVTVVTP